MVPQPQRDTARLIALDDARHFGSHGNNLPRVRAPKLDELNWRNIVVHLLVVFLDNVHRSWRALPERSRASPTTHSRGLVGAPALSLVAHSLLHNVLVGVALLASLVTTLGL
jgi:hypothetical protein